MVSQENEIKALLDLVDRLTIAAKDVTDRYERLGGMMDDHDSDDAIDRLRKLSADARRYGRMTSLYPEIERNGRWDTD